jgi:hypothetical protein
MCTAPGHKEAQQLVLKDGWTTVVNIFIRHRSHRGRLRDSINVKQRGEEHSNLYRDSQIGKYGRQSTCSMRCQPRRWCGNIYT